MRCVRCPMFESWNDESDYGENCRLFESWDSDFQYENKEQTEIIGCYIEKTYIDKRYEYLMETYEMYGENRTIAEVVKKNDKVDTSK